MTKSYGRSVDTSRFRTRFRFQFDVLPCGKFGKHICNNENNEIYGSTRLQDILNKLGNAPLNEITKAVKEDADKFCDGQEQLDELSILVLRMK